MHNHVFAYAISLRNLDYELQDKLVPFMVVLRRIGKIVPFIASNKLDENISYSLSSSVATQTGTSMKKWMHGPCSSWLAEDDPK